MKVVVAGSRSILYYDGVRRCIEDSGFDITELVHGTAAGVDSLAEYWANENGIKVSSFKPDYDTYGSPKALFVRNDEMAQYADVGIIIWDGLSTGTQHMMDCLTKRRKEFKTYILTK